VPPAPAPEAEPPAPTPSQGPACAEPPAPADGDDDEPAWLRSAASDVGLASPPSTPPRTLSLADKAEEEEDARASPRTDTRAGGRRRSGRRGSGNRRSAYKARAATRVSRSDVCAPSVMSLSVSCWSGLCEKSQRAWVFLLDITCLNSRATARAPSKHKGEQGV